MCIVGIQKLKFFIYTLNTETKIAFVFPLPQCVYVVRGNNSRLYFILLVFVVFVVERKKSHSVMSDSLRPHGYQAPLSMRFSRQEYWSGLPFPSPGNFPTQGSNPGLPRCRQMLYRLSHHWPLILFGQELCCY